MNIKEAVNKFDTQIREFTKKKDALCNNPGKDFSRNQKQNFESINYICGGKLSERELPHYARMERSA